MYRFLAIFCSAFILNSGIQAQNLLQCGTDQVRWQQLQDHPEILEREAAFNLTAAQRLASMAKIEDGVLVIPVVFHVIHDYGPENISDDQIFDAMENINADFSATNADFGATIPEFQDIATDCQIEFRLAGRELSGTCSEGITRTASMRTYNGNDNAKLNGWQSGKYLNIWVVKSLPAGTAAYAYYPTSIVGMMATVDGIICRYDYVGTIGTSGSYAAHVLSHEIGHYLNLQHVWGNSNAPGVACGDDMVPDTPMTEGWTSCNIAGNTCGGSVDNVQNHMEYSYCSTMFSVGQKNRMYAALESEDAMRNNLWTEENLLITGTTDGYDNGICVPTADFYASQRYICEGESVTFHDVSYNGDVTSRNWSFPGASPETSTDQDPVVTYSTPGWHTVTLTASNASGSGTKTFETYLFVAPSIAPYDRTYFGDFNSEEQTNNDWVLHNRYPDPYEWKWRGSNGYWNTGCIWLNSLFGPDLESDVVISPVFDLSDGIANNAFFKYSTTSYGLDAADYTMSLKMYYSNNCGDSWISMGKITGADIVTSYGGSSPFYPVYPDQWASAIFNIPSSAKTDHVQFKIEFVYNPYVNNVFIDDFNFVSGALSVQDPNAQVGLQVMPNPVSNNAITEIQYSLTEAADVYISICDLSGRVVSVAHPGNMSAGTFTHTIDPSTLGLSSGCYFVRLQAGQQSVDARLIVL